VIPQEISTSSASIRITAHAKNLPEDSMISYTVLTTTGTMLANKSVPASAPEYICHLTNPCLWNGKTSPKLYVVVAGLIVNGSTEDQIVLPFGLRDLSMESNSSVLVHIVIDKWIRFQSADEILFRDTKTVYEDRAV
jgi:beta-galactosidase/beta-glucuronidase